jgi:hypothetical protein
VAHELGHFLMEWHELSATDGFRCRAEDMQETRTGRQHVRQESQANAFAIGLLAPAHLAEPILSPEPDLRDAQRLRDALDVSLEAAARRMIALRSEPLGLVISRGGVVRYPVRNAAMPWIDLGRNDRLPSVSEAARAVSNGRPGFTEVAESPAIAWSEDADLAIFEQTRVASSGDAITLLWIDRDAAHDPDDPDDDLPEWDPPRFR